MCERRAAAQTGRLSGREAAGPTRPAAKTGRRAQPSPARENWSELWDDLEPLLRGVRETRKTFFAKDRPFYVERSGYGETVYFNVSYSAIPEADGSMGGVLCIVSETTERVRAVDALRESEARLRELNETWSSGFSSAPGTSKRESGALRIP